MAETIEEAMTESLIIGEPVRLDIEHGSLHCNNCTAVDEIGLEACLGCCGR